MAAHNTEWRSLISGAFGQIDKNFALHPADERRARQLVRAAKAAGASAAEVSDALVADLLPDGTSDEQINRVRAQFVELLWELIPNTDD